MRASWPITGLLAASLWFGADPAARGASAARTFESARSHWSYQPIRRPELPLVKATQSVQTPMDAFLLARLEAEGLTYSPPATRRTWLRRVSYDLIGLPPTWAELEAFEGDDAPEARARVVDRLLGSPRYGERWGRHWLDVARYSDTKDLVLLYGRDALRPYAYTYRDYVIRAFNEDIPFDDFVRDQLAADLVTPKLPGWRLAALGFLTLGRLFDENPHDQIDDQIDTVTRGFLGLTVSCARCHDHKYDAITMADYYGLYGVFASTERPYALPLIEEPDDVPGGREFEARLGGARQELENHIDAQFAILTEEFRQRLGDYLMRAATTMPDLTETAQFALSLTPEDYRPGLMQRTRRFLVERAKPGDRVFGAWAELMALSDADFAGEALPLVRGFAARGGELNPLVVEALGRATLRGKADVARAYGEVFDLLYEVSNCRLPEAGPPEADERELLEVVAGLESPVAFPRRDTPDHMSRPAKDRYNGLVLNLDKIAAHATNRPPARAMVVAELAKPYEAHIFLRGSPARLGAAVPRGFLRVLNEGHEQPFGSGSGRLELAHALTAPGNPLTARVIVNRVWMHHFGEPLVATPADFGSRSEPPSHPELLDWLASDLIANGWSLKHLHRVMVLSGAYAQGTGGFSEESQDQASAGQGDLEQAFPRSPLPGTGTFASNTSRGAGGAGPRLDPDNRLLWQYPRRRLDLETMRDTLLFVSGRLDETMGGPSVELGSDASNRRRTVYGLVDRQNLSALFRAFDFASPDQCAERRPRTTVPQQALFALNSPFVMEQARALAALPEVSDAAGISEATNALFRHVLGREATVEERTLAREFIASASGDAGSVTPWAQFAQVLLASNESVFLD